MSIEKALADLTAALERNTAAILGGKSDGAVSALAEGKSKAETPASAEGKRGPGRPKKGESAGYEAQHTVDEMRAALNEVKEAHGTEAAKSIIRTVGKAEKIAEITDLKIIDACYAAAKAKMEGDEGDEGDDDEI